MRKQRVPARDFPFQGRAHGIGLKRQQYQPVTPGKMLCRCFACLLGSGKMHKPVRQINRRPKGVAIGLKRGPFVVREYFVYQHGRVMPRRAVGINPEQNAR